VGAVLAGAVAFRVFVFLLPLFLSVVVLVGAVAGFDDDGPRVLGRQLGMSSYVVDSIETASEQSRRSLWVLLPLALWGVYAGGLGAAKVLRAVHTLAWDRPPARPRSRPATAAVTFLLAVATVVSLGATQWARARGPGLGLGAVLASVGSFVVLWWVASWLLPRDPDAPWTALVPGALLVGGGLWLAHVASALYLARRMESASQLYGSLGVAATILAWLYLIGRLMVASAMLNATLWERRARPTGGNAPPGDRSRR
jgi:uncharacterized BrkB/YihY/UPF0761 family membrane protein